MSKLSHAAWGANRGAGITATRGLNDLHAGVFLPPVHASAVDLRLADARGRKMPIASEQGPSAGRGPYNGRALNSYGQEASHAQPPRIAEANRRAAIRARDIRLRTANPALGKRVDVRRGN